MAPYHPPPSPVILITGCSSGIGYALASHLANSTASRVVATARNPDTLSSLPTGPNILKLALDVTSEESIQSALSSIVSKFGRLDVLVNNAGYNILADAETVPLPASKSLLETNFWGPVRLTQLALPLFRNNSPQKGGLILNITSLGGRLAFAGNSYYHASKFALEGFTESLSKELPSEWNIHLSCIEPGGVKTEYAHTSVKSKESRESNDKDGKWPEYADPGTPTNLLRKYHEDPRSMEYWAEADVVAEAIARVIEGGVDGKGDIPLRVPLGADSWGLQKKGLQVALERLDRVKEISLSTSKEPEKQLASIEFLQL